MLKSIATISTFLLILTGISVHGQDTLTISMADQSVSDEIQVIVPFGVLHFNSISYFSFSINWDSTRFEYNSIAYDNDSGLSEVDYQTALINAGALGMQWIDPQAQSSTIADSLIIFNMIFDLKDESRATTEIIFSNDPTGIEAGNVNGVEIPFKTIGAEVTFEQQATSNTILDNGFGLKLYQNKPNPFTNTTTIPFDLNTTEEVVFKVFDVNGQNLIRQKSVFPRGLNSIELNKLQLGGSGVYEYSLSVKQKTITKKLILMDQ